MQAMSGLMSVSGEEGRPPVRVTVSIVDIATGMWGAIGILAALQKRGRDGLGGFVDTSLYETALAWMTVPITAYLASGEMQSKTGSGNAQIVPYQAFETKDGHIMVAAGNDGLFQKLCQALQCAELASDKRFLKNADRVRNRDSLIPPLSQEFARLSSDEAQQRLEAAGVPCGPIQTVDHVVSHPQTQALDMIQAVTGNSLKLMGLPLSFDQQRLPVREKGPALGADTAAVLGHG
jgi:crotonobetainyl-CoA:carnitine CoA-transferase CaiB-like acyl-CoA transferase